jgi:zinc protease
VWHSPAVYKPGDAALDAVGSILSSGKNSRLYKRLVYDMQIAQSVSAFQASSRLGSLFYVIITARPSGDPPEKVLERIKTAADEEIEKLRLQSPTDREMQRVLNQTEASFYSRMESIGGFGGKADQINGYFTFTGDPDYFAEDLARYRALRPADIQNAVREWLPPTRRLEFSVVPDKGGK